MRKQSDSDFSRHRVNHSRSSDLPKTEKTPLSGEVLFPARFALVIIHSLEVLRKEPLLAYALPSPYARNSLPSLAATGVANTLRRGCARKKL